MNARQRRERLALRLNAWIAQEISAGSLAQARTYGGELTTTTYVLDDTRLNAPDLNAASELLAELALDLRCLSDLRAGKEVGARAWMLVAERIGADGPLPTLADVLATRRAYWAACDAAHDARRARDKAGHARTPETPSKAAASRSGAQVSGEVSEVIVQGHLDAYWAEMDRTRAQGEPLYYVARETGAARQDFEVWRWRKRREEAARVAAWMDQAPAWGEEVRR